MSAPIPLLDQYKTEFNTKFFNTFSKHPYEWQSVIGSSMLQSILTAETAIHQLCIRPAAGGGNKLLLFTTLAACLGRITICITPLLSIGADQTFKHQNNMKSNSTTCWPILVDHSGENSRCWKKNCFRRLKPQSRWYSSPWRVRHRFSHLSKIWLEWHATIVFIGSCTSFRLCHYETLNYQDL